MFDIQNFLSFHNIPVRYKGENVSKENLNICCPFCIKSGRGDTNFHMGINPKTLAYGCWRNPKVHGGRKIEKLVRLLLDCSWEEAQRIVHGVVVDRPETDSLFDTIKKILNKENSLESETINRPKELIFPPEFIEIKNTGVTKKFWDYLSSRGFDDVGRLIKKYSIFGALNGEYTSRIIFPIFHEGELVSWTSRTIINDFLRYKDLSVEKSLIQPKQLVYNFDELEDGGNLLFVNEGLFDCMKLDYYFPNEARATCIFTKSMTDSQMQQIRELSSVFNKIIIMLDNDAKSSTIDISRKLSFLPNVSFKFLPTGIKDPGDMSKAEVLELYSKLR